MDENFKYIVPTPSDFGDFVYCGVQWALNKNHLLNGPQEGEIRKLRSLLRDYSGS